jgi:hypothetical protein
VYDTVDVPVDAVRGDAGSAQETADDDGDHEEDEREGTEPLAASA